MPDSNVTRTAQRPLLWLPYKSNGTDDGPTLTSALALMKNLGGVRLLTDIVLATALTFPNGGPVALDLNGHTVTSTVSGTFPDGCPITCHLGAASGGPTTLATFTPGSATVTVASATGALAGRYLYLKAATSGWNGLYRIEHVAGATLTLDRPLPPYAGLYTIGDAVTFYASADVPQYFSIVGGGALVQGTAVVTISLQSAWCATVRGIHFGNATATSPSDAFGFFNLACYNCHAWEVYADGFDAATNLPAGAPSVGFGIQGSESCTISIFGVRHVAGFGSGFLESFRCGIYRGDVSDATFGVVFSNDTLPERGSFDCWIVDGSSSNCRSDGVAPFDGSKNCGMTRWASFNNVGNGITVSGAGESATTEKFQIVSCNVHDNAKGVVVNAHAVGTAIVGGNISENATADVECFSDLVASSVRTTNATATAPRLWSINAPGLVVKISGLQAEQSGAAVGVITVDAGLVYVSQSNIKLGHASSLGVWLLGGASDVVWIDGLRVEPSGGAASTFGIFTQGGTIRFAHLDADACATPVSNAGGFLSGTKTVTLNGLGTAQAIAWPNFKTSDEVFLVPVTAGGTPGFEPLRTYNPGTGFSVTGAAGDTRVFRYTVGP